MTSPCPDWKQVKTHSKGRCAVAARQLPAGYTVHSCSADFWALQESERDTRCAHCLKAPTGSLLRCATCRVFSYCSRRCQRNDETAHKAACSQIRGLPKVPGPTMLMVDRLLQRVAMEIDTVANPNDRHCHQAVEALVDHYDEASPSRRKLIDEVAAGSLVFFWSRGSSAPSKISTIVSKRLGGYKYVAKLLSRLECNAFAITVAGKVSHQIGQGLFLDATMFNHSCEPNCIQLFQGTSLRLRTLRPIFPGEELTIAYIDVNQHKAARQSGLIAGYGFVCHCARCTSVEEAWWDQRVTGMGCPRRGRGCVGLSLPKGRDAALFRAWRTMKGGDGKKAVESHTWAHMCTSCGAQRDEKEVKGLEEEFLAAEEHEKRAEECLREYGMNPNALVTATGMLEGAKSGYARYGVPYVSIRMHYVLARLMELNFATQDFKSAVEYGTLAAPSLEAICPRNSVLIAYHLAILAKVVWLLGDCKTTLKYTLRAMRVLQLIDDDDPLISEIKALLEQARRACGS